MKLDKKDIQKKLEYIGLKIGVIPDIYMDVEPIEFRPSKMYEDNMYREYRYIDVKDIQILVSQTNKSDSLEERYKKSRPLMEYLNNNDEECIVKHTKFLKMVKRVELAKIKKMEIEQENLNKKIPFKVKYENSHLWQIYYSESTKKYFILVSTEDLNNTTVFYLIKKQLEKGKNNKIFVPVKNISTSGKIYTKTQIKDIENYIWLFTKDWPLVYELYDKDGNLSINFIGKTCVYDNIKSDYKITLNDKQEAAKFYKLLKAMFIIQTEISKYFLVRTNINEIGGIDLYVENIKIEYNKIPKWLDSEYNRGVDFIHQTEDNLEYNYIKIETLKNDSILKEIEYLTKEKQISTFLECKKTFFGKFKYYFKYSKKNKKNMKEKDVAAESAKAINENNQIEDDEKIKKTKLKHKKNVTLDDLIKLYRILEKREHESKNLIMDINAIKLKNKNFDKKIENATKFIEEIDNHKKSIFEFWRYTNKDEIAVLPEGEQEEVNVIKKIKKTFDYENDIESFGIEMDKLQREKLSNSQLDSLFVTSTNIIDMLNKIKNNQIEPKEIQNNLRDLKRKIAEIDLKEENDEFDIFSGMSVESSKVSNIKDKAHRENEKNIFNILNVTKSSKSIGYKMRLEKILLDIRQSFEKVDIIEDVVVYKAFMNEELENINMYTFNLNPENEIEQMLEDKETEEINFYKLNLDKGSNAISLTNSVFYDNQNKTLPLGQDISTRILVDMNKIEAQSQMQTQFNILKYADSSNDFSEIKIISVNVEELEFVQK